MTDMTKQTEADRLANQLDYHREYDLGVTHTGIDEQAAAELRRQQAEIERLNEALASVAKEQPAQQEPGRNYYEDGDVFERIAAMKKQPAQRKPLTDEQIDKLPWGPHEGNPVTFAEGLRDFARAIEAAHGIKGDA